MGPQLHLSVTVCNDADDAIAKGYDYASKGAEFKPIEITEAAWCARAWNKGVPEALRV